MTTKPEPIFCVRCGHRPHLPNPCRHVNRDQTNCPCGTQDDVLAPNGNTRVEQEVAP